VDKVRYMISDAADMVHVETHVLRYWEEELELAIPRNEMGHRYYTRDNIKEFQKIKDLKDQGYQLKAIRMILHSDDLLPQTQPQETAMPVPAELSAEERMCQFRELMSDIVGKAIAQNNEELSQSIGKDVQEMVIKEMNYLMREQDAAQEERYRKLDSAIRGNLKKSSLFVHNKKRPAN
jgi:DNA-binding transcriptional MerR regulator